MRVIIVGAGEVGYQIAKTLSLENHEVIVVEKNERACQYVQSTLDVLTISGNGANISTLREAGIQNTDMVVAVTDIDEVNMVACMSAREFGVPKKIARIREVEYMKNDTLIKQQLGVDFVINPEIATSREIVNLLESPVNVAQIQKFAEGKVQIFELKIKEDFPFIGKQLKDINLGHPILIVAIYRKGEIIIPSGEERILLGDNLYIVVGKEDFLRLDEITGTHPVNIRNVMILGGSKIGIHTASILSKHSISTKLIEANREKCQILAQKLPDTLVINGDGTDVELLRSEGIETTDGFVAVTGDEESNVLVSLLAKHLGSNKAIAKVDRPNYTPVLEKIGIDAVVNPRITTTSSILRFIQKGEIISLMLLKEGKAEVIELIAQPASKIINKSLRDANLPKDSVIGAIVRRGKVIVPHGDDIIQPQDKVIIFTLSPSIKNRENVHRETKEQVMKYRTVLNITGSVLTLLGISMVFPLICGILYQEEVTVAFLLSIIITVGSGFLLKKLSPSREAIGPKEGFAIATFGWILAAGFGTFPFLFTGTFPTFIDAYFESMSGFTTTGATVLTNIERNPHAILFWRDQIQWLGGMGIIVLLVAILPSSGIEGMQLFRAEVPGPTADKIRPTAKNTAKILWLVYMIISALEVLFLYCGGMSVFDAFTHMFGTMPTGGFTPRNLSVGAYNNPVFDGIIIVFMFMAGTKFFLNYRLLFHLDVKALIKDREFLFYVGVILTSLLIVTTQLRLYIYQSIFAALRYASFQIVSITTTTGFVTTNYDVWPALSKNILLILMFIGGCAGSTGGAIKNVRVLILLKEAYRELYRLVHPRAVTSIRLGNEVISEQVIRSITGFFLLYIFIFIFCTFIMAVVGLDMLSAAASVAATLGNVGPGLGMVGPAKNYAFIHPVGKIVLVFCMLLGRLEIYTVLVLLIPTFWRK